MITTEQLKSIGFTQDVNFWEKHELTSVYRITLNKGVVHQLIELRGERIIKYPIKVDNIKDLILAYEIASGAIVYHESEQYDNNVSFIIISVLLAVIGLFIIFTLLTL